MSQDLASLSVDLRRAAYFFQQNDVLLAQKFVDRGLEKYDVPKKIKDLMLEIRKKDHLKASELAMTASLIL